jgi:hypothetical protein
LCQWGFDDDFLSTGLTHFFLSEADSPCEHPLSSPLSPLCQRAVMRTPKASHLRLNRRKNTEHWPQPAQIMCFYFPSSKKHTLDSGAPEPQWRYVRKRAGGRVVSRQIMRGDQVVRFQVRLDPSLLFFLFFSGFSFLFLFCLSCLAGSNKYKGWLS